VDDKIGDWLKNKDCVEGKNRKELEGRIRGVNPIAYFQIDLPRIGVVCMFGNGSTHRKARLVVATNRNTKNVDKELV